MEKKAPTIVKQAAQHVLSIYANEYAGKSYTYHNFTHTKDLVKRAKSAIKKQDDPAFSGEEKENILVSAWFLHTGAIDDFYDPYHASARRCRAFLEGIAVPEERIAEIEGMILSFRAISEADSFPSKFLQDLANEYLGRKRFFNEINLQLLERERLGHPPNSLLGWEEEVLDRITSSRFATPYFREKRNSRRVSNLEKQYERVLGMRKKAAKKAAKKEKSTVPQRGVETMYRVTYRNHINLSSIADAKANMMISINTIILSVMITLVGGGFTFGGGDLVKHMRFVIPLVILLSGALVSVLFAIQSASPTVTKKKKARLDPENQKTSILFFGNFTQLKLPIFIDSMNELAMSKELLYDSMTIDMYYLGLVLKRKYRLLTISYRIFSIALVLCVLSFFILLALP